MTILIVNTGCKLRSMTGRLESHVDSGNEATVVADTGLLDSMATECMEADMVRERGPLNQEYVNPSRTNKQNGDIV